MLNLFIGKLKWKVIFFYNMESVSIFKLIFIKINKYCCKGIN